MTGEPAPAPSRSFRGQLSHLWDEGMAQHVVITAKSGSRVLDVPLIVVIVLGILAPWAAALGAVIAVVAGGKISTERQEQQPPPAEPTPPPPESPVEPSAP